ncbi:MAG: sensor histidine kinase [Candidatus Melainabacteria bacterium]|nr:sensor histidine kinase [Candidatus Melainabacteria bacterium]
MNLKLPKLKIRHQLLLLIIAPLIFQIGISTFLYTEVSKANNNLADLVYRRRILAVLDDLQRVHVEFAYTSFFYSMTKNPVLADRTELARDQVIKKKQELTVLTRNHPEYERDTTLLLRRIDECNHGIYILMGNDALSYFGRDLNPILMAKINIAVNQWLNPMGNCFAAIRSEPVTPESFSASADRMRKLISLLFASCVAFTGLIAFWGSRVLIFRLSKIYSHVNQVKAGNKPLATLPGEDELSELDQAIAASAEKLLSLRSFKEDLIQAVSHDLRAPLTSMGGILTLARDGAYGDIGPKAKEILAQPVEKCRALAALVNDVLDLERVKAEKFNLHFDQYSLAELVEMLQAKPQLSNNTIDFSNDDLDLEFHGDLEAAAHAIITLSVQGKSSITFSPDRHGQIAVTISPAIDAKKGYHENIRCTLANSLSESCGIAVGADIEQTTLIFPMSAPTVKVTKDQPELNSTDVRRSRIAEAGLALVIVPAIICCSMLWMLSQMIDESQNEIQKEYRSYQVLQCLNAIHASHMYSGICTLMFNMTKGAEFAEKRVTYAEKSKSSLDKLEEIFRQGSDKEERDMAKRLEQQLVYITAAEQDFLKSPSSELRDKFTNLPSVENGLPTEMFAYRARLVLERQKLLLDDRSSELRDRKKAILILLIGIVLVTGSTIVAHRLLSRILTQHLYNAIGNAKLLNSAEPLQTPTKGLDEMALLDKYIYDSALELRHLENQRLELLSLLREELKQPILEASAGIARVLDSEGEPLPPRASSNIGNVVAELSRLGVLVDDLTNIEMLDKNALQLNVSEFSVKEVLSSTITALQLLADLKSIKLVAEPTDIQALGDRERVLQILVNLVSNAIKFSPNNSQVTLSAARVEKAVKISVTDEGPGISEDDQAKIFQKFEQASKSNANSGVSDSEQQSGSTTAPIAGAGLGLHICKMLIEAHRGSISVSSTPGRGATFSIVFPDN